MSHLADEKTNMKSIIGITVRIIHTNAIDII